MGIMWRWAILSTLCAIAVQGQEHASGMRAGDELTAGPAWSEFNSSMQKMHIAMTSVKASGNSDVDFVRLMLSHHQAAIAMAKTQLLFGKDPQMRRLAQEIVTDQQSEIDLMQMWLKQHPVASKEH
jgi:uncharacterized protein (DUF305 family)